MNIEFRVLKSKILQDFSFLNNDSFHFELHLMQPAIDLQPTVLIKVVYKAQQNSIFSIQFRALQTDHYHYMNFPSSDSNKDGEIVENIIITDLPLDHKYVWAIISFSPECRERNIATIKYEESGIWVKEKCLQGETKFENFGLYGMGKLNYLLIGGAPKSGTTWVEKIINYHPDALATGENNFFQWPGRHELLKLMNDNKPAYFYYGVRQLPPFRSQLAIFFAARAKINLEQIGNLAQVKLVADKSPRNTAFSEEIKSMLPNWKYIHCLRNPLDILVSRFFHEKNLLRDSPELSIFHLIDRMELIRHTNNYDKKKQKLGSMFENKQLFDFFLMLSLSTKNELRRISNYENGFIVHYEDLLDDFDQSCAKLLQFCDLNSNDDLVSKLKDDTGFKKFTRGRSAGEQDASSFFRKGVKGDHVNYLTEAQIDYAKSKMKDMPEYSRYI